MPNIGEISCLIDDANTGIGRCNAKMGLIRRAIGIPKGTYVTNADLASISTFISGKLTTTASQRWYALPTFVAAESNKTARGTEQFNYNFNRYVGETISNWTFTVIEGENCGYQAILKFKDTQDQYDWLFIDSFNQLWGWVKDVSGTKRLYGFSMTGVNVDTFDPPTGSTGAVYKITYAFADDTQLQKKMTLVQTGMDWSSDFIGINSVNFELISTAANGAYTLKATTACGGANMGDLFGSTLADVDAWIANRVSTGNEISISSVTFNSTTKNYVVDLDQTDTDYSATNTAYINFEPIADLLALGVYPYEGIKLQVTMN